MNDETEQLDAGVLADDASDEALEAAAAPQRGIASNLYPFCTAPAAMTLDHEEFLINTVSDEALEAAGGMGRAAATYNWLTSFHYACC